MRRLGWSGLAVVLSSAALLLAVATPLEPPWRPLAALVFVMVAPGAALVPLLGLRDTAMQLALVVPLSFAVVTLVAVPLFYAGVWSADRQFAVLLALCALGVLGRLVLGNPTPPDPSSIARRALRAEEAKARQAQGVTT